MTRNIDELSNLKTKSEPPEQYFKKMDLDEEQVERRIEYTEKANELFDVILILLLTMQENGSVDYGYARGLLESWLLSLIAEFTTPDDYLIDYATDTAYNFIDASERHEGDPWYTSADRSLYNAENSANDVLNYDEYQKAIEAGKTHKKWITENDRKVRDSHRELHNKVIPIKEYFRVGVAKMRFPKDYEYAGMFPEELVNCRCTIDYLPKDKNDDLISREESTKGVVDKSTMVQWSKVNNPGYGQKISRIEPDRDTAAVIKEEARGILDHRSGSDYYEDLVYIDSLNPKNVLKQTNYNKPREVEPTEEMKNMLLTSQKKSIISLHNHAGNTFPSLEDVDSAQYYKYGVIICHNGDLIKYTVNDLNAPMYAAALSEADAFEYTDEIINNFIKDAKEAGVDLEVFKWK